MTIVANTTTPMDGGSVDAIFTLPVTSVSYAGSAGVSTLGHGTILDSGTAVYPVTVAENDTTSVRIKTHLASGNWTILDAITSANPFTWTTNDEISVSGIYEAA